MSSIRVWCTPADTGWVCAVQVGEPGPVRAFKVGVSLRELARFDPAAGEPTDLVRRSFEFLLAREPKASILSSFDVSEILRYYPEYEMEIRRGR